MSDSGSRRLSIDEAARLIYQTAEPTEIQLSKVRHTVARGVLQGSTSGNWVATDSVAAYLAARIVKSTTDRASGAADPAAPRARKPASPRRAAAAGAELPRVYRGILRDYFAAVLRRKQPARASAAFRGAVWSGQIALVLFPIVVIVGAIRSVSAPPAEQVTVEAWIDQETREHQILEWFPPQPHPGRGMVVRVRYKYVGDSPKAITTDRRFRVDGRTVTLMSDSD